MNVVMALLTVFLLAKIESDGESLPAGRLIFHSAYFSTPITGWSNYPVDTDYLFLRALGKPQTKSTIVHVDSSTNDESIQLGADHGS